MASLPVVIFQFALSPYKDWQSLAWTGALIITLAVLALSIIGPRTRLIGKTVMSVASVAVPSVSQAPTDRAGLAEKVTISDLDFFYGDCRALKSISLPLYREQGDRLHRPVGLRQVDFAARAQPHVRPLSEPARDRRGHVRRHQYPFAAAGSQSAARAHRHGVSEADAVSDVDLREHRLRHPAVRAAVEIRAGRPGRERRCGARRCGTRSRTSSTPTARACPAASSSGCASPAPSRCGPR